MDLRIQLLDEAADQEAGYLGDGACAADLLRQAAAEIESLQRGCLEWTQTKPAEVGLYLRVNPPISFVVKVGVFIGLEPGVLVVPNPENPWKGKPVNELPDRFWWYGPVPSHGHIIEGFVEAAEVEGND